MSDGKILKQLQDEVKVFLLVTGKVALLLKPRIAKNVGEMSAELRKCYNLTLTELN